MPRPIAPDSRYVPALDGIRALAVIAVMGYHFGVPGFDGGLLGVSVFFTLSGFLITDILLSTWDRTRGVDLQHFWLRRARRLLPALVAVLVVVLAVTVLTERGWLDTRLREAVAALFYVANWTTIASGVSYFDRIAGPGPLDHLWSLAIEEQFYLVWPVLLLVMLRLARGDKLKVARVVLGLAVVSSVLLFLLAEPGFDNTRAYEGTDTRAAELLVGAALALTYRPILRAVRRSVPLTLGLEALGLLAVGGIVWMVVGTTPYSMWMYRGGLALLSVCVAVVLLAAVRPRSLIARGLALPPLLWVGERSYGIYLWHMPVAAFAPQSATGEYSVPRAVLHVLITLALAALSWHFLEDPIRRHGLVGALRLRRPISDRLPLAKLRGAGVAVTSMAMVVSATAVLAVFAVVTPSPRDESNPGSLVAAMPPVPEDAGSTKPGKPGKAGKPGQPSTGQGTAPGDPAPSPTTPSSTPGSLPEQPTADPAGRPQTSCERVVHVGDSTSVGLITPAYLPDRKKRIPAQYRAVGVEEPEMDILGARSIVETYKGQPNAEDATTSRVEAGYDGCWVFAMGTNDTANQVVGGVVPLAERIDRLMKASAGQPVMWLTVKTRLSSGPWLDAQQQAWNAALVDACAEYPQMRVYDWRSQVRDEWFISDGIHFTSAGYVERGRRTANALATAFPEGGSSPSECFLVPE